MTSVHSNLVQSDQYALLKKTSQRHCISNVRHDSGYSLDAVTTRRGFASARPLGWIEYSVALKWYLIRHSAGLNTVWL
jgi:hypothetical protein